MNEAWVVDASPLIALAKIGKLDLLSGAGRTLVIPTAVAREVSAGPKGDPAATALAGPLATCVSDQGDLAAVLEWGLGAGETAVLSMARTRHAKAIVDDREARSAAKALGVSVLGTLGVVLLARAEGRIMSAADVLRDLRRAGLRLDDSLVEAALRRFANEEWKP